MRRCRSLRIRKLIRRLAVGAIVDDRVEAARRREVSLNKLRSNRDIRLELNDLDHETSRELSQLNGPHSKKSCWRTLKMCFRGNGASGFRVIDRK